MKMTAKVRKSDLVKVADQLGEAYVGARERLKAANDARTVAADKIKAAAADYGEEEGARMVLRGNKYVVGFTTTSAAKSVDWARFQKNRPKLYARLCSMLIDEKKVEDALADGTLPRALLEKYTVPRGNPIDRLLCEEIGKETDAEDNLD